MHSDWELVHSTPDLLAAVRARYSGADDVLDVLWWLEHPGTAAPSGALDPTLALERLRRDRYRRVASAPYSADEALRVRVQGDRAAATLALRQAIAVRADDPSTHVQPKPRLRGLVAAAALAFIIGTLAGWAARPLLDVPRQAAALSVFGRATRPQDRPQVGLARTLSSSALFRHLHSFSTVGIDTYAVRTRTGDVCLLVVVLAEQADSACTSADAFARSGLSWMGSAPADPVDDAGTTPSDELRITWSADGAVRIAAQHGHD